MLNIPTIFMYCTADSLKLLRIGFKQTDLTVKKNWLFKLKTKNKFYIIHLGRNIGTPFDYFLYWHNLRDAYHKNIFYYWFYYDFITLIILSINLRYYIIIFISHRQCKREFLWTRYVCSSWIFHNITSDFYARQCVYIALTESFSRIDMTFF